MKRYPSSNKFNTGNLVDGKSGPGTGRHIACFVLDPEVIK